MIDPNKLSKKEVDTVQNFGQCRFFLYLASVYTYTKYFIVPEMVVLFLS